MTRESDPSSDDLHEWFEAAREGIDVAPADRADLLQALLPLVLPPGSGLGSGGDPSSGPADGSPPPPPAPDPAGLGAAGIGSVLGTSVAGKVGAAVVGLAFGTAVGAGGHAALVRNSVQETLPAPAVSSVFIPRPPSSVAAPTDEILLVVPSASVLAESSSPRRPAVSASAAPSVGRTRDEQLAAERALVDVARTAVGRGQGQAALEGLARHAQQFPLGLLSEERDGLWIQALLLVGKVQEARARVITFRRFYPMSMMLPALERAVGVTDTSDAGQ